MSIHEFTLRFKVPYLRQIDDVLNDLQEAGCNSALVGLGQFAESRVLVLKFHRESDLIRTAVMDATRDVRSAIPGDYTIEVSYDD